MYVICYPSVVFLKVWCGTPRVTKQMQIEHSKAILYRAKLKGDLVKPN